MMLMVLGFIVYFNLLNIIFQCKTFDLIDPFTNNFNDNAFLSLLTQNKKSLVFSKPHFDDFRVENKRQFYGVQFFIDLKYGTKCSHILDVK